MTSIRTTKRKFAKDLDNCMNMDFNVKLNDYNYNLKKDEEIDLNKAAASLMTIRSHHAKAAEEYKKVLDTSDKNWSMYNSLKALYEVAYINMKFVELQVLNQLYENHIAALATHSEDDYFYPANVLWKAREFIVESCRLDEAKEFFKHPLFKKPTHKQNWEDHGMSIDLNLKIILASEVLMHRVKYNDMEKLKTLLDMSVEVLDNMTHKYHCNDDIKYVSTE